MKYKSQNKVPFGVRISTTKYAILDISDSSNCPIEIHLLFNRPLRKYPDIFLGYLEVSELFIKY